MYSWYNEERNLKGSTRKRITSLKPPHLVQRHRCQTAYLGPRSRGGRACGRSARRVWALARRTSCRLTRHQVRHWYMCMSTSGMSSPRRLGPVDRSVDTTRGQREWSWSEKYMGQDRKSILAHISLSHRSDRSASTSCSSGRLIGAEQPERSEMVQSSRNGARKRRMVISEVDRQVQVAQAIVENLTHVLVRWDFFQLSLGFSGLHDKYPLSR